MSDRSGPPSDEGEGDEIRPHGDDRDSSEESSDEDPEEARRIAEGFIQDDDDEDEDEEEDPEEARRRRRKEKKRRKRRERERRERHQAEAELSEDELELIQENRGRLGGPSEARPFKRTKREDTDDEKLPTLQDIFREDEERRALEDDDEDDMGDFIEDDEEEEEARGETEEQRRERRRAEKLRRREAAKARPDAAGMDRGSWDEIFAVFGDGQDYDWALEVDEGVDQDDDEEAIKKDLRLEDVFDPAEIKAKRLQDEDKAIAQADRPERHQLVNSTLSDNPILTPDTLFPPPLIAAGWAYNKISIRTQYLFCDMHPDGSWPLPTEENPRPMPDQRRPDLAEDFLQAVTKAFDMMFIQHLEVPFLWHYRRDEFAHVDSRGGRGVQFLQRDDLWTLYTLGVKLRAIHARCNQITAMWSKIKERKPDLENDYLETILLPSICTMSVEAAAEGYDWLLYHYPDEIRQIKEEEAIEDGSKKLPERAKDNMRQGTIMGLVKEFGVSVSEIAVAFNEPGADPPPVVTSSRMPLDVAQEYCGDGTFFYAPEDALNAAKNILMTDFIKDPSIRQQSREWLQVSGAVTVTPTERGMSVIDDLHTYYTFKFLTNKPIQSFAGTPQFLHMLKAEEEGLITIEIHVGDVEQSMFYDALERCLKANDFGDIAVAWNEVRREICHDLVTKHLIPSAAKWVKEYLKTETEDYVADFCRQQLEFRVNVRPYATPRMEHGEIPSVLALSNGHGDRRDAIMAVMLDSDGNIRTQTKFDTLREEADRASFIDLIERREPKVVVVGGFSAQAGKLRDDVEAALRSIAARSMGEEPPTQDRYASPDQYQEAVIDFDFRLKPYLTPTIVVSDDTARQYMHSEEAKDEFPTLPVNGRYALALARYTQNPLNAYCKLGRDIASVIFMEQHQKLITSEKLLLHLERGLVNATCFMGIEINSCCSSPYQRAMLPFVAGLGPRKADALVNGVMRYGSLVNRLAFSRFGLFGPTVFENAVGFLSIETDLQVMMLEKEDQQDQPDPLDLTRIHPADYEFAQRMARDAMDQDADDVADQHDSHVVQQIMLNEDRQVLLNNLNLNDFALTLQRQGEGNRRYLLAEIVKELIQYRSDQRPEFWLPNDWEVLTMFTGETPFTVGTQMLVSATVRKALSKRVFCSLESGMDAVLELNFTDGNFSSLEDAFKPKQTFKAVVVATDPRHLQVQLSVRAVDMANAIPFRHSLREDPMNDRMREYEAKEKAAQRKRRKAGSVKRVVHHPNWHTMNSGQAEQYLASQQRGDVVIRPSSKGNDHLAVTWKVDDDVYQHIDVQEIDKPNEYSLGRILRVAEKYSYSDLDELIINHVKAIARKFDEVQMHDKYKPETELEAYLKNYVQAHPGRSMYGFSIDSDRPGYLKLCFLNKSTKDGGVIQQWPVKVLPGAYQLHTAVVPDVAALCNAFKAQYSNKLADQGGKTPGVRSGRTPMQGGRTPMPGGRTPAPAGSRGGATPYGVQPGRTPLPGGMTPNPYGAPQAVYGMPQARPPYPPNAGPGGFGQAPPQNGYGGPPPPGMGGPPGIGMNPERAAMLARQQQY